MLTWLQIAGNMLGARARAAEYHAAKAASARQQANQDEDDQKIPKPAPISLSAFTRNAFANRNKGTKTFKPLVLSEEEERISTSSVEFGSDFQGTPSPQPKTVDPPRPASVPVSRTVAGGIEAPIERTIQTPYRYREAYMPSIATSAMFPDEGYGFPPHGLPPPPHYLPTSYHKPSVVPQPMVPTPHMGYYVQPDCYAAQYSYHDPGMPPMTPQPDACPSTRPPLQHAESMPTNKQDESHHKSSSEHTPASPPETPPKLGGGQRLYVFGPDDVSPTKMEVKQQAREKYLAEHAGTLPTPTTGMADRSVGTPEPLEVVDEDELMRYLKITGQARSAPQPKPSGNLKDLLIDRSSITPVSRRAHHVNSLPWKLDRVANREEAVLQGKTEADWPYLGGTLNYESNISDIDATPTKTNDVSTEIRQMLDGLRAKRESPVKLVRPPPGLEQTRAENSKFQELESEQITTIKFPMVEMNSPEWLEVRMPTAVERDQTRRVCHAVRTSSISDKHRDTKDSRSGMVRDEWKKWSQVKEHDLEGRRERVKALAQEMQGKWEYGGSFRSATMSKSGAEKHAGTVKAVGGMMAALSMQVEDSTGSLQRGSRPYCQAPEYAMERNAGTGKSTSVFETDEDASRSAPSRLARDPRFRPQLADGLKLAAEDGRIPRMFARRVI